MPHPIHAEGRPRLEASPEQVATGVSLLRTSALRIVLLGLALLGLAACAPLTSSTLPSESPAPETTPYPWKLPAGIAPPVVPASNPMTPEKVELGRRLFYEKRLSVNGTFSCASCHDQKLGFADGKATPVGATGEAHPRNSMGLANVAYSSVLTWGNPLMISLETQAVVPLVGDTPLEIGFGERPAEILALLEADPDYAHRFKEVFPDEAKPVQLANIAKALAAFQRTLLSFDSPFDRAQRGNLNAMSPAARRGADLFFSERLECAHCHDQPLFTDSVQTARNPRPQVFFHNTGVFNIGGTGAFPPGGEGVFEVTENPNDMGKFKAPSLRNIAVTGPYFHDGSAKTLEDVIEHYRVGGRTITEGPHAGVGAAHPLKDPLIGGFSLSESEKADLLAFLESLTDETFLNNPDFANPFEASEPK